MPDFLVFALVAPMGAFGDIAGHEQRGSQSWPGRSALLGLLGAAQGVRRDDKSGQAALTCWQTAVGVLSIGPVWRDFHTVQTVPSSRAKRPATRAEAVRALKPEDNGLITRRDYRSDCAFAVALWGGDLEAAKAALERPRFVPYLGRKSCPLSAPMAPRIATAGDPVAALEAVQLPDFLSPLVVTQVLSDTPVGTEARTENRWDIPLDRDSWHFGQRQVHVHVPGTGEGQV